MDIIPAIASKSLRKDPNCAYYLLIVDAYLKLPRLYLMEIITTEEVMYKLYLFQSISGKVDEFVWWYFG